MKRKHLCRACEKACDCRYGSAPANVCWTCWRCSALVGPASSDDASPAPLTAAEEWGARFEALGRKDKP